MAQEDLALLERWTEARDGEAFSALVSRYGGVVFGACHRILGNPSDAEDVAQECFVALSAAGKKPGPYLGAWLHRVATYHALSRVRAEERRKRREQVFVEGAARSAEVEWDDIHVYVDEAINELPERYRAPVVRHFLEGQTQEAIGAALGVSRRVVSYRISQGVERCRESLKRRGVYTATGAALAALLAANGAEAAPASLIARLGKVAVAGPGTAAPIAALAAAQKASAVGSGAMVAKAAVAAISALMLCGAGYAGWKHVPQAKGRADTGAVETVAAAKTVPAPSAAPVANAAAWAAPSAPTQAVPGAPVKDAQNGPAGVSREALEKGHVVKTATRKDIEKMLDAKCSMEMKDIHIAEFVDFIASSLDLSVVLDERVVAPKSEGPGAPAHGGVAIQKAPAYVTDGAIPSIEVKNVPLADALHTLCGPLGLEYATRGNYIWVSSPALIASEKLADSRGSGSAGPVDAMLDKHVSVNMTDVHLADVFDYLSSTLDANLALDYRVVSPAGGAAPGAAAAVDPKSPYVTDGRLPYVNLKEATFRDVIEVASRMMNLTYTVEDGFVWISTPERIKRENFAAPDMSRASAALVEALVTPMTVAYANSSLSQALGAIEQKQHVRFMLDAQSTKACADRRSSMDLRQQIPLSTALTLALRKYDLAYAPRDQYIVVTSAERARSGDVPESALVPIQSMAGPAPSPEPAPQTENAPPPSTDFPDQP